MRPIVHTQPGKFSFRCLFKHVWGQWSFPRVRTHTAGGLLGYDYIWTQRKCKRCGAIEGVESNND